MSNRLRSFLLVLLASILVVLCSEDAYVWYQKEKYYFPSIDIKMKVILEERCYDSLEIQKDNIGILKLL